MSLLAPYPAYKDSRAEWIDRIPTPWKSEVLKRSTYVKARVGWKGLTSEEFEDEAFAYLVTGSDFRSKFIDWSQSYQVSESRYADDPFIQLQEGDLLVTKDGTIGKVAIVRGLDKPACLNSGIFVVRPTGSYSTEFLYWVLQSSVFSTFVGLTSAGSTILHLYQNVFVNFALPVPRPDEQRAIVRFLDREAAEIDAFIADKEELIGLLTERRAATISHAVTKGLDPSAPMKDSGVEWLGKVPAHWKVTRVSRYFGVVLGKMLDAGKTPPAGSKVLPYLRAGNIQEDGLNLQSVNEMPYSRSEARALDLRRDDLLVVEGGAVGVNVHLDADMPGWSFQKTVNRVRPTPRSGASSRFLGYALDALRWAGVIDMVANKSTIAHLTAEKLERLVLAFPPPDEQQRISDVIQEGATELDAAIADAREAIALSHERRAALISAAVTGKIDVRGGA